MILSEKNDQKRPLKFAVFFFKRYYRIHKDVEHRVAICIILKIDLAIDLEFSGAVSSRSR